MSCQADLTHISDKPYRINKSTWHTGPARRQCTANDVVIPGLPGLSTTRVKNEREVVDLHKFDINSGVAYIACCQGNKSVSVMN